MVTRRELIFRGLVGLGVASVPAYQALQYTRRLPSVADTSPLEKDITAVAYNVAVQVLEGYYQAVPDSLPAKGSSIRSGLNGFGRLVLSAAQNGLKASEEPSTTIDTEDRQYDTVRQSENLWSRWSWDATNRVGASWNGAVNQSEYLELQESEYAHKVALVLGTQLAIQAILDGNVPENLKSKYARSEAYFVAYRRNARRHNINKVQHCFRTFSNFYAGHLSLEEASEELVRYYPIRNSDNYQDGWIYDSYKDSILDSPVISLRGENGLNTPVTLLSNAVEKLKRQIEGISCNGGVESRYAQRVMVFMASKVLETKLDHVPHSGNEFPDNISDTLVRSMLGDADKDGLHNTCDSIQRYQFNP